MDRADSHDGARDGVGGADRDPGESGREESQRACRFGAETSHGFELGDPLAHRFHNTPATHVGSQSDGRMRRQNDGPVQMSPGCQHVRFAHEAAGVERAGDNSHGLLGVVGAVSQAIRSR